MFKKKLAIFALALALSTGTAISAFEILAIRWPSKTAVLSV